MDSANYTAEFYARTYDTMIANARALLKAGRAVVLDATFIDAELRARVEALAAECGVPFRAEERDLAEGTLLVLFTDGLVESRGESIEVGLQGLLRLLGGTWLPLEETCDMLLGTLNREPDDDVALLLARRRSCSGPTFRGTPS